MPGTINEMSPAQYLFFVQQVLAWQRGSIDEKQFRLRLVAEFIDLKGMGRYRHFNLEKAENIALNMNRLAGMLDTLFVRTGTPPTDHFELNLDMATNPLPEYRGLIGPQAGFRDLSFLEFIQATSHYNQYALSGDDDDLASLTATLYRPAKWFMAIRRRLPSFDGQARLPFVAYIAGLRAAEVKRMPEEFRHGVLLWFAATLRRLRTTQFLMSGRLIDFSLIFQGGDEKNDDSIGLPGVLFDLARTGEFGDVDATGRQNLYDVLIRLYQIIRQNQELEKKLKK
jgi:hypothetical protein